MIIIGASSLKIFILKGAFKNIFWQFEISCTFFGKFFLLTGPKIISAYSFLNNRKLRQQTIKIMNRQAYGNGMCYNKV